MLSLLIWLAEAVGIIIFGLILFVILGNLLGIVVGMLTCLIKRNGLWNIKMILVMRKWVN